MLRPCKSLIVAQTLLQTINCQLTDAMFDKEASWQTKLAKSAVWVECFDNCREQGHVIIVWNEDPPLRIAFAENRNSDDIVIYCYRQTGFGNNSPRNPEDWNGVKYFGYGQYQQAADYVIGRMRTELGGQ